MDFKTLSHSFILGCLHSLTAGIIFFFFFFSLLHIKDSFKLTNKCESGKHACSFLGSAWERSAAARLEQGCHPLSPLLPDSSVMREEIPYCLT